MEYTAGAEREIVQGVALGLDLFYRSFHHLYETQETNRLWSNTGGGLVPTGGYRNGRRETISDLGTPEGAQRRYRGATLGLTKREGRLKIKASYTLSQLDGNVLDGINNPWGDIAPRDVFLYGDLADDHRHELKTSATYQVSPWLSAGLRYRYYSGRPYSRLYRNDVTGAFDLYRARVGVNPGTNVNDPGDDRALRLPRSAGLQPAGAGQPAAPDRPAARPLRRRAERAGVAHHDAGGPGGRARLRGGAGRGSSPSASVWASTTAIDSSSNSGENRPGRGDRRRRGGPRRDVRDDRNRSQRGQGHVETDLLGLRVRRAPRRRLRLRPSGQPARQRSRRRRPTRPVTSPADVPVDAAPAARRHPGRHLRGRALQPAGADLRPPQRPHRDHRGGEGAGPPVDHRGPGQGARAPPAPIGLALHRTVASAGSITFELRDAAEQPRKEGLLGLPYQGDWIAQACVSDRPCLRNMLGFAIGAQLATAAPRARFVEIYYNEEYKGLFQLIAPASKDQGRVDAARPRRRRPGRGAHRWLRRATRGHRAVAARPPCPCSTSSRWRPRPGCTPTS